MAMKGKADIHRQRSKISLSIQNPPGIGVGKPLAPDSARKRSFRAKAAEEAGKLNRGYDVDQGIRSVRDETVPDKPVYERASKEAKEALRRKMWGW